MVRVRNGINLTLRIRCVCEAALTGWLPVYLRFASSAAYVFGC